MVEQYQKTSQIAEALERLTEAYYALGVYNEAKTAAAVLGANYPGSPWYKDAYKLLHGAQYEAGDGRGLLAEQDFRRDSLRRPMLAALTVRDIVLIETCGAGVRAGTERADRRNRRGQIHSARCVGLGGGRPRRRPCRCASGRRAGLRDRRVRAAAKHAAFALLREQAIPAETEIVLRRTLAADGRTRAFVNDEPVGVALLRDLGASLLEVHGQTDDRGLFDVATHRGLLDAFGGT